MTIREGLQQDSKKILPNSGKLISLGRNKMPVVKVRHKNQVTIPQEIFSQLHLEVGDFVEVTVENGRIVMIPKKLTVKADIVPLTEEEQQILSEAKRKIECIREDILQSEGLSTEEIEVATKVGLIDTDQG